MSTRPLKVAMVFQGDGGGVYDYASHIANSMSPMLDLTVFTNAGPRILRESVNVIRVPHVWTRMFNPSFLAESIRIARALGRLRADVIHLQHFYPFLPYFLVVKSRPHLVVTLHEIEPVNRYGGTYGAIAALVLWQVYFLASAMIRRSDRIIVLSETIRKKLVRKHPEADGKTDVIPYPIVPISDPKEDNDTRTVLFFGNMWWTRGLDILLKEMLSAGDELGKARLVVAGGGKISKEVRALLEECRKHFEVDVRNYFVPGKEAEKLFAAASFIVLPYRIPTSSAALNTAYSYCKPVIASRMGYLQEMVKDGQTGFLFDIDKPGSLASAMKTLLNDVELRSKMERNIREFRREFQPEEIARMHVASYKKAASHQ